MFALAVVLGRELGAETYGRYGLALALAIVIAPLADLGLTPYLVRESARDPARGGALLPRALLAKTGLSAAAFVLAVGVAALLVRGELLAAIVVVLASQLLDGGSALAFGYLQGLERMTVEARLTTLAALSRGAGGIVLVLTTGSLLPALAWLALVGAVQLLLVLSAVRRARAGAGDAARPPIEWRAVLAMGSMAVFVLLYARIDAVLVGWLRGEVDVGWYTAAYTIMLGLQIVPWMLAVALTPVYARTHGSAPESFRRAWDEGLRALVAVALPLALVPSLLAGPLVDRLFGGAFAPAGSALAILAWATPGAALGALLAGVLRAAGLERWLVLTAGSAAAVNVTLNLALIPRWGIDAAASVTVATEVAAVAAMTWVAVAKRVVPLPRLPWLRFGLAGAVLAGVAVVLRDGPVELAAAASLATYAAVVLGSGAVKRDELWTLLRRR